jgi:hypothetical protein
MTSTDPGRVGETARPAPDALVRVFCTLEDASGFIGGVRFAPCGEGRRCSEPVAQDVAAHFCRVPGYSLAPPDFDTSAVDEVLATMPTPETPVDQGSASLRQTITELERANHAMAQDLEATRRRADEAERKLAKSEVPRLEAEIERLRRQADSPSSILTELQAENAAQKTTIDTLRAEVAAMRAHSQPAPGRRVAPPATAAPPA